nr:MAG TPA: hypothetical protein [Bacteriophage sp.]
MSRLSFLNGFLPATAKAKRSYNSQQYKVAFSFHISHPFNFNYTLKEEKVNLKF